MVLSADELPGSGEDFEKLGRAIEPALAESISLFLLTNMTAVLTDLSLQEQVTDLEPNAFLAWVEGLDAADLAARARDYAEKDDYREAVRSPKALAEDHPRLRQRLWRCSAPSGRTTSMRSTPVTQTPCAGSRRSCVMIRTSIIFPP
jgi:hypothetical protein